MYGDLEPIEAVRPDPNTPASMLTTEDLVAELMARQKTLTIAIRYEDKLGLRRVYQGDLFCCLGMLDVCRDEILAAMKPSEPEKDSFMGS